MRNGNSPLFSSFPPPPSVLTVPMRNGNLTPSSFSVIIVSGSYRTYEEWKHPSHAFCNMASKSSYRTYEEWKRENEGYWWQWCCRFLPYLWGMETLIEYSLTSHILSSYRTYEEWKQVGPLSFTRGKLVLTVPMRNGNLFPVTPF